MFHCTVLLLLYRNAPACIPSVTVTYSDNINVLYFICCTEYIWPPRERQSNWGLCRGFVLSVQRWRFADLKRRIPGTGVTASTQFRRKSRRWNLIWSLADFRLMGSSIYSTVWLCAWISWAEHPLSSCTLSWILMNKLPSVGCNSTLRLSHVWWARIPMTTIIRYIQYHRDHVQQFDKMPTRTTQYKRELYLHLQSSTVKCVHWTQRLLSKLFGACLPFSCLLGPAYTPP